jgi:hypothetical protein
MYSRCDILTFPLNMATSSPTPVMIVDNRPSSKTELASGHLGGTCWHRGEIGGTWLGWGWGDGQILCPKHLLIPTRVLMLRAMQLEEEDKCCAFGLSTCRPQGSIEDQSLALWKFIIVTTTYHSQAFPTCCMSGTHRMYEGTYLANGHSTGSQFLSECTGGTLCSSGEEYLRRRSTIWGTPGSGGCQTRGHALDELTFLGEGSQRDTGHYV